MVEKRVLDVVKVMSKKLVQINFGREYRGLAIAQDVREKLKLRLN